MVPKFTRDALAAMTAEWTAALEANAQRNKAFLDDAVRQLAELCPPDEKSAHETPTQAERPPTVIEKPTSSSGANKDVMNGRDVRSTVSPRQTSVAVPMNPAAPVQRYERKFDMMKNPRNCTEEDRQRQEEKLQAWLATEDVSTFCVRDGKNVLVSYHSAAERQQEKAGILTPAPAREQSIEAKESSPSAEEPTETEVKVVASSPAAPATAEPAQVIGFKEAIQAKAAVAPGRTPKSRSNSASVKEAGPMLAAERKPEGAPKIKTRTASGRAPALATKIKTKSTFTTAKLPRSLPASTESAPSDVKDTETKVAPALEHAIALVETSAVTPANLDPVDFTESAPSDVKDTETKVPPAEEHAVAFVETSAVTPATLDPGAFTESAPLDVKDTETKVPPAEEHAVETAETSAMTPATLDPEPSTKNAPPDIKNESLTEIKVQSAQEPAFGQTSEPSHHKESIETEVKEAPPAPEPAVNIMQPSLEMPLTLDQTKATSTAEPKIEQNNSVSTPGCPDSPDEPKETSAPAAEMASGGPNGNEIEAARLPQKKNGTSPKRDAKPIYRAPGWKPRDGTMTRPITGNPKLLGRKASPPIAKLSESNEQETGPLSTKATDPHGDSTTGKKPEIIRTPSGLEIIRTRSASPRVEVSPLGDQALPPVVTITGFFEGHDGPAKKRKNKNRNGRGRGRGQGGVRDPPPATAPDIPIA